MQTLMEIFRKLKTRFNEVESTDSIRVYDVLYNGDPVGSIEGGEGSFYGYYQEETVYLADVDSNSVSLPDHMYAIEGAKAMNKIAERIQEYESAKELLGW